MNLNLKKSVTLVELIIAISLFGVLVVAFTSFDTYSRQHVIVSDRRARLQNELAYALEQMSKYVLQGTGNFNNQPLQQTTNGFRIRVDLHNPPTPADLSDDTWISYTLSGNTLSCSLNSQTLSTHIISNVSYGSLPTSNPAAGFYYYFTDSNTMVEIGLVGRWDPSPLSAISVDNPQVVMKTKVYTRCSSAR